MIDMSYSMGLSLRKRYDDFLPNVTKCSTWQDVKASHKVDYDEMVIKLDDISGILIILAVGLSGAMIIMIAECFVRSPFAILKVSIRGHKARMLNI